MILGPFHRSFWNPNYTLFGVSCRDNILAGRRWDSYRPSWDKPGCSFIHLYPSKWYANIDEPVAVKTVYPLFMGRWAAQCHCRVSLIPIRIDVLSRWTVHQIHRTSKFHLCLVPPKMGWWSLRLFRVARLTTRKNRCMARCSRSADAGTLWNVAVDEEFWFWKVQTDRCFERTAMWGSYSSSTRRTWTNPEQVFGIAPMVTTKNRVCHSAFSYKM